MDGFAGKRVFVSGGASGIGRAAAGLLAEAGARVVIADCDERLSAETAAAIGETVFVPLDVREEASVAAAVVRTVDQFGGLDAAINCAGIAGAAKAITDLDAVDWDRCDAVNLRGMFLCIKHQARAMIAGGGGGAICAVSSAAAVKGLIDSADYCAAKAGILGLVRGAAVDCAGHGVRINALLPGATATPLAARSSASNPRLAGTLRIPLGRQASAEEMARTAVWLVSDAASYMTGAAVSADGGMTIA